MGRVGGVAGVLFATLCIVGIARAQQTPSTPFIEAQRAEARGDYHRAETLYDQAFTSDSTNTAALFGRARMRSWLGAFPDAIRDYQSGLKREPDNPQASSGLAWTYAWSHHFDEARSQFEHLAKIEPYYLDARKGLAYVDLWRGNAKAARRQFEQLSREDQGNPEYVLAIAQAAYLEGDLPAAHAAYAEALKLKPGFEAARSGLQATETAQVQRSPALTLLGGSTDESGESHAGLRFAQLSMQVTGDLRLWIIHDRGLAFDVFAPDGRELSASTTTVGGFYNYSPHLAARLEVGERKLPDETDPVVTGEQVFFVSGTTIPKVGFWWTHGKQNNQWVVDASVFHRLSNSFSLEPAVYVGDDGINKEYLGAVLGTYETRAHLQLGLGYAAGSKEQTVGGSRSVNRLFGNVSWPVNNRLTVLFYGWRESDQGLPTQTVLALGATVYL